MPSLTGADAEWLFQRDGAETGLMLVTVTGPEIPGAIRLVRNTENFTSRGQVFSASWFDVTLPSDNQDIPRARFEIPNINREVGLLLIEGTSGMTVTFEMVRPSNADVPLYSARMLKLRTVKIDPVVVSGELSAALYDAEPYIPLRVSPRDFPGIYLMEG